MPPLETIAAPSRSRARTMGLLILRIYISLTAVMLIVKTVRLAGVG
jgi:hypothetical protein